MEYHFRAGVGSVDITPEIGCDLVGKSTPQKSETVATRLFIKSLVISDGANMVGIVTLDNEEYPIAVEVLAQISSETGIPVDSILIAASHTHTGPSYRYYEDNLKDRIVESIKLAIDDLSDCAIGVSTETVAGVNHNRRVIKDGYCVNTWSLPKDERTGVWASAGGVDNRVHVISILGKDGMYKAILFNFACHCVNSAENKTGISADYPGYVRECLCKKLGYETEVLFMPGACGDMNGLCDQKKAGEIISNAIANSLENTEYCKEPKVIAVNAKTVIPDREPGEFPEKWIKMFWGKALDYLAKVRADGIEKSKPRIASFSGVRIGDDVAIVTNPGELFVDVGLEIKKNSPFRHTIVSELTNGSLGYVPTAKAYEQGGYETIFGSHSHLSESACEVFYREAMGILDKLREYDYGTIATQVFQESR